MPPIRIGLARLGSADLRRVVAEVRASAPGVPGPLARALREHAGRASLDQFVWKLLEAWLRAGTATEDRWAFVAAGHLGSDATALALAPLIRKWPGEGQHKRAILGLELLRAMGTDTAILQLGDGSIREWERLQDDYQIVAPFPQLHRPVYPLHPGELDADRISRGAGVEVNAARLRGILEKAGWQRHLPAAAPACFCYERRFPGTGITALAFCDPGFWMGIPLPETPDQTLTEVCFVAGLHSPGELPGDLERLPLAAVDPVVRSEVLITVESLVSRAVS